MGYPMTIPSILMMVRMAVFQTAKPYMPYIDPKSKWHAMA